MFDLKKLVNCSSTATKSVKIGKELPGKSQMLAGN